MVSPRFISPTSFAESVANDSQAVMSLALSFADGVKMFQVQETTESNAKKRDYFVRLLSNIVGLRSPF
jgi:hypothetical protein